MGNGNTSEQLSHMADQLIPLRQKKTNITADYNCILITLHAASKLSHMNRWSEQMIISVR